MKKLFLFIFILINLIFISSCKNANDYETYEHTFFSMDTMISVKFYDEKKHDEYYKEMKNIFNNIASKTSDYEGGLIYELNDKRKIVKDDTLINILNFAEEYRLITEGYFNPYMGKITHLWKDYLNDESPLPDKATISFELDRMNNTTFSYDNNYIYLNGKGNIDLGGMAKGYALRECDNYLKEQGCKYYLIDAGNSSISFTSKKNDNIKSLLAYKRISYGYVDVKNLHISTSSPEYQFKTIDSVTYHHLISPKDGYPTNNYQSINVFNDDAAIGDILSTALFSMDLDTLKAYTKENNIDCLCFNKKIIYKSEGCDFVYES